MYKKGSKEYGDKSEDLASNFLETNGFSILERNFFARKLGEIDIIAIKDNILHFIEVKSSQKEFEPIYNLTPSKLNKVIKSAYYFMKLKNLDLEFSIDAITVHNSEIEFIENITV